MAYTNLLRENNSFQKKQLSQFAVLLEEGTENGNLDAASATSGVEVNYKIGNLPEGAIITNAYVHVKTVSDAATSAAATLGTTESGAEVLSAVDLDAATGSTGTFAGQSLTGSGVPLYLGVTWTGAVTNVGKYYVVVEYLEPTKNTGEYTSTED